MNALENSVETLHPFQLCPLCGEEWSVGIDGKLYKHILSCGAVFICNVVTGQKRKRAGSEKR